MRPVLGEIAERSETLANATQELLDALGVLPTAALQWPPALSLSELVARIGNLADLLSDLARMPEDRFALAPMTRLVELRDRAGTLVDSVKGNTENLKNIARWGGTSSWDQSSAVIHSASGNALNLGAVVGELQSRYDTALETYLILAAAVRPRGIGTFAAASRALAERATEAAKLIEGLKVDADKLTQTVEVAKSQGDTLSKLESEARRLLEEVEKLRRTIEENAAKADASTAAIDTVRGQASSLEAAVNKYQSDFTTFQNELDRREETLRSGDESLNKLIRELEERKSTIEELVGKAEEMLGGATTAGLASTYKQQADGVDRQLRNARWWYYGSIAFLLASVGVALNLFGLSGGLPSLPNFEPRTPTGTIAVQALSALGSRGLMILPSLLLAGFTAHRHSALFRLKEEYGHKYSAAASVQGFKLQAPSYQESIAAAVFAELLKNPAEALDTEREKRPNAFLDRLIIPRVEEALKRASNIEPKA